MEGVAKNLKPSGHLSAVTYAPNTPEMPDRSMEVSLHVSRWHTSEGKTLCEDRAIPERPGEDIALCHGLHGCRLCELGCRLLLCAREASRSSAAS